MISDRYGSLTDSNWSDWNTLLQPRPQLGFTLVLGSQVQDSRWDNWHLLWPFFFPYLYTRT